MIAGALVMACGASSAHAQGYGCHTQWPVVAHRANGVVVSLPAGTAPPVACAAETGYATSESTLAVTNTGALIYSPANTENSLARSPDGGSTWSLTTPAGEQPTAFWNTVDPDVITDHRTGRVFWSHATGPVRNEGDLPQGSGFYLAAAYGFQVYTSADDGRSFTTADYSTQPTGDWEKIFVGPPPPASTGAAQPSGYPDVVYLCANAPLEVSGPGRLCYKSLDGGATFTMAGFSSPTPSNPPDVCPPLNFNTGVVDSSGTTYQPVDCQQSAYVLVSHDEGASYTWLPVKDAPTGTPVSGTNLQLAVDSTDTLYAMWTASDKLYLALSRDHGKSWGQALGVAGPGLHNITRPTIAAGGPGQVALAYYATGDPSAHTLTAYVTQTADGLDPQPLFYSGALNDPAAPIYTDEALNGVSPRADFVGGSYDAGGMGFWAGMVKQFGQPDANRHIATTGYVGHLAFGPLTPSVIDAGGSAGDRGPAGTTPGAAVPGAGLAGARGCVAARRLIFAINPVPGGHVVRADAYVNRRLVQTRRGRDVARVDFPRPHARHLVVRIVTTNNRGGRVVTVRSFNGCARTRVSGRVHRHRRNAQRRPSRRRGASAIPRRPRSSTP